MQRPKKTWPILLPLVLGISWWGLSFLIPPRVRQSHKPQATSSTPADTSTRRDRPRIRIVPSRRKKRRPPPPRRVGLRRATPARSVPRPTLRSAVRNMAQQIDKRAHVFGGTFPDGSKLLGMQSPKQIKNPPPRNSEVPRSFDLWKVSPSGQLTRIAPHLHAAHAVIAPASGRVAVISMDRTLHLTGPQGAEPTQKLRANVGYHPAFNPQGTQLAYTQRKSIDRQTLYLRNLQTQLEVALKHQASGVGHMVFSPDGKEMIFSSNRSGILSLWKVSLPKGTPTQLTNRGIQPGGGLPAHFVPAFAGKALWAHNRIVYDAGDALWTILSDGKQAQKLGPQVRTFRWLVAGKSLRVTHSDGTQHTVVLP